MKINTSIHTSIQNNMDSKIQSDKFLPKYKEMIKFIYEHHLMDSIEDAYRVNYVPNMPSSIGKVNSILLALFNNQEDHLKTLNIYMQRMDINYSNQVSGNAQTNARLKKLKIIYSRISIENSMAINEPFNINSSASSIQKNSPNININLVRNDGQQFYATLNFNSLMNLTNQFIEVLGQKLEVGNNIIDLQLLVQYLEASSKLNLKIQKFKKEKNVSS